MSVTGIRRVFWLTDKVVCLDKQHRSLELGALSSFPLSHSQRPPFARRFYPGTGKLTDDARQVWNFEFLPDILDEVDQILLILRHGVFWIDSVVPAVIPDESRQFISLAVVTR